MKKQLNGADDETKNADEETNDETKNNQANKKIDTNKEEDSKDQDYESKNKRIWYRMSKQIIRQME